MKLAIKILVCILTFLAALGLFSILLNRRTVEMTSEMSQATLPVVSVQYADVILNRMEGHKMRMEPAYMRESITPLSDGRILTLSIDTYDANVEKIAYEVRSVDGERLVEDSEVENFFEKHGNITATITLKDLLEDNTEYTFITILTLESGEELYYYTRVIMAYDYDAASKITFAKQFSEKTFDEEGLNDDIAMYLESDSTGDNTNYAHVNIHSSFEMVTWENLDVEKESEVVVTLQELAPTTATVSLSYVVSLPDGRDKEYYQVEEHYRMRKGTERIYLLDYERTMDRYFFEQQNVFFGDKIMVGISDSDLSLTESEDGNQVAFVKSGSLFACNNNSDSCARVFSFYDEEHWDWRTRNNEHGIRILSISESGDIAFCVFGYMNRGMHEGESGILVYLYDGVTNTLEEAVFLPYAKSFEMLRENVEKLSFMNKEGELFLYLEGMIIKVNTATCEYETVVKNITDQTFQVSEDHTMVVWMEGETPYNAREMVLLDLSSGSKTSIKAGPGEYVKSLGFMGEDLLYGSARSEDVKTDSSGEVTFPMYVLQICNKFGILLKSYEQEGLYITGHELNENMITLERMQKDADGEFKETTPDTIMNNQEQPVGKNVIEVVTTEHLKKIVQIALRSELPEKGIKYMVPKELRYEGDRTLSIECPKRNDRYFVYHKGEIAGVYTQPAEAVRQAYELAGVVMDDDGDYVWIRGNLATKNQIMKITGVKEEEAKGSMAVCLETTLRYEGYSLNAQEQLNMGKNAKQILEENMTDKRILDLTGCSLETILFYVNKDIPVLAVSEDQSAVLIVGFNEQNTVWMNPENGKVYKVGMNDSRNYFEENGNCFITYMDEK